MARQGAELGMFRASAAVWMAVSTTSALKAGFRLLLAAGYNIVRVHCEEMNLDNALLQANAARNGRAKLKKENRETFGQTLVRDRAPKAVHSPFQSIRDALMRPWCAMPVLVETRAYGAFAIWITLANMKGEAFVVNLIDWDFEIPQRVLDILQDPATRDMWLRGVQQDPANFLAIKFSMQLQNKEAAGSQAP